MNARVSAGIGCPVPRIPAEASPLADHVSATRILCGALVFPTIATIVGKLMFSSVNSNLQRTILVGPTTHILSRVQGWGGECSDSLMEIVLQGVSQSEEA